MTRSFIRFLEMKRQSMAQVELNNTAGRVKRLIFGALVLALFFSVIEARGQSLDSITVDRVNPKVNDPILFTVKLESKSGGYACAFEIDFGDGSPRRRFRVFREKDATQEVSHIYNRPGVYAAKVDGAISLLDEGLSLKSFNSLFPALPCGGSRVVALNVVSAADNTDCIPLADESREISCAEGFTGRVVQRRSYSCPGPTAQSWVTEINDCKLSSNSTASAPEAEPAELINRGWESFVGRSGSVDEFEAFRLTAEGVQRARSGARQEVLSIGTNNLRVIHMCARDPRVRDYSFGRKVGSREVGNNKFSSDNYIWGVFLRTEEAESETFIKFLRTEFRSHPVTGYIERNSGRLPKSSGEALQILKAAAAQGDHNAAKWIGYSYECGPAAIDVSSALKWMVLAADNAKKSGVPDEDRASINDRLNRLRFLNKP